MCLIQWTTNFSCKTIEEGLLCSVKYFFFFLDMYAKCKKPQSAFMYHIRLQRELGISVNLNLYHIDYQVTQTPSAPQEALPSATLRPMPIISGMYLKCLSDVCFSDLSVVYVWGRTSDGTSPGCAGSDIQGDFFSFREKWMWQFWTYFSWNLLSTIGISWWDEEATNNN